jgi:uncharacterized membrane protein YhaH (DUF805 family)
MAEIIASIRHGLRRVVDFSGRDSKAQFWPYAIFLFLLSIAAGMILWVPVMADMFVRLQRYLIEHPEGLPTGGDKYPGATALPPELMPDFSAMVGPMAVVNLLFVMLLAAALVRRLHDRAKSGWWALLPVPFMIYSQIQGPQAATMMIGGHPPNPSIMLPAALSSLFYWIAFVTLVVLLVGDGTAGPNRYGPEPAA